MTTWTVMSIPGRNDDGSDTSWYAYNRLTRRSIACRSADHARETVRALRLAVTR
jgi:hypothetical protein